MLKLYVWEGVLTDWTPGIAFAMAETPDEARALLVKKRRRDLGPLAAEDFAKEIACSPAVYRKPAGGYCSGGG